MLDYEVKKSFTECYDIFVKDKRCSNASVSIRSNGTININCNGSYVYKWDSFGGSSEESSGDSFKIFLFIHVLPDKDYLYDCIRDKRKHGNIDMDRTLLKMQKKILENRRRSSKQPSSTSNLSAEEARELWEELEDMLGSYHDVSHDTFASMFYHEITKELREKVFSDDYWNDDILVETYDMEAKKICEFVAPILMEILKKELRNR